MAFRVIIKMLIINIFLTSSIAYGSNIDVDKGPIEINTTKLKVGVSYPSFYPFDIIKNDNNLQYEGISRDILLVLSEMLNVEFEFIFFNSRNEAINALINNEVDIIPTANNYEETFGLALTKVYFEDHPILYRSAKIEDYEIKSISLAYEYLDENTLREKFPDKRFLFYPSREEAIAATVFGETDAVISDLLSVNYSINNYYIGALKTSKILDINSKGFAFALKNERKELKKILNNAIDNIDNNMFQLIMYKWNGGGLTPPTIKDIESIKNLVGNYFEGKEINIGISNYLAPFSYLDEYNNPQGIVIEILNMLNIYSKINYKINNQSSLEKRLSLLESGDIDLLLVDKSISSDRNLIFSNVLYSNPYVYIIRNGQDFNKVSALCMFDNKSLMKKIDLSLYKVITVDNYISALDCVDKNINSTAIMPVSIANYYITHYFNSSLSVHNVNYNLPTAEIVFAANTNNKDLIGNLNKILDNIPRSQFEFIANMWRRNALSINSTWMDYKYSIYTITISFFIIIFISLTYLIFAKRAFNKERTLKKEIDEQLKFVQDMLDSIPMPIYFLNEKMSITITNKEFKKCFYSGRNNLLDLYCSLGGKQLHHFISLNLKALKSKQILFNDSILDLNGNIYSYYQWLYPYCNISGNISGVIGGYVDVSEKQQLIDRLERAKIDAERANSAKSLFLATMSHEIRTPMNVIISALDLVMNHNLDKSENNSYLKIAYNSANELLALIGDILDITKIEENELDIMPSKNNIKDCVNSTFNMFYGLAKQKNISMYLDYDESIISQLLFDRLRLKQILSNVLSNAIKFTDDGFVKVIVKNKFNINDRQSILFEVIDTGVGIPTSEFGKLFKKFSQANNSKNRGGTGLGLMICKKLCELMGGNITLTSNHSKGTTVTISLEFPIAFTEVEKMNYEIDDYFSDTLNILIVDDHSSNRLILSKQLTSMGHNVITASSGEGALDILDSQDNIQIIITDCHMPGMNGYELATSIRSLDKIKMRQRVILGFTANAQLEVKDKCIQSGMDDCMFKPISVSDLREIINKFAKIFHSQSSSKQVKKIQSIEEESFCDQIDKEKILELLNAGVPIELVFDEFKKCFLGDLANLNDSYLSLEESLEIIHKIKGASNILGFTMLVKSCIHVENSNKISKSDLDNILSVFFATEECFNKIYKSLQ
ncbi:transporter substrate-binding domain-containing protein [Vibrio cholerae]|nr:transporter substrate-binding domain-containing protein [Vibrio cholerae]